MVRFALFGFCSLLSLLAACPQALCQSPDSSTPAELDNSGPFHNPLPPLQSQSPAAKAIARQKMSVGGGETIRVRVFFIDVDPQLREQIYESIGSDRVITQLDPIPNEKLSFIGTEIPDESLKQASISSPTALSHAVIGADQMQAILDQARSQENSRIMARPQISANPSQTASVSMIEQRPFLVGLSLPVPEDKENFESNLQVLNEGTEVRVVGDLIERGIHLKVQIQSSRVADTRTQRVFGFGDQRKVALQMPLYEVTCVNTSAEILPNRCLLVDPYLPVFLEKPKAEESVIQRVSSAVFREEVETEPQEPNHMMILLQPERVASKMSQPDAQGSSLAR